MRFNRMIAIVLLLVSKRKITVQVLADFFEVSSRTIYRDLEALDYAGVPIISTSGYNGGISLVESYYLEKQLFSSVDFKYLLLALYKVNFSGGMTDEQQTLINKLQLLFSADELRAIEKNAQQVVVDLSTWDGQSVEGTLFSLIEESITTHQLLTFTYTKLDGSMSERQVAPYQLLFKQSQWYLYAVEQGVSIGKLFLLKRMKDVQVGAKFVADDAFYQNEFVWHEAQRISIQLRIQRSVLHIFDQWPESVILSETANELFVQVVMEDNYWVETFLLGLGEQAEVLAPLDLKEKLRERIFAMAANYREMGEE